MSSEQLPQDQPELRPIPSELESRPTKSIKVSDLGELAEEAPAWRRSRFWLLITDPFALVLWTVIAAFLVVAQIPRVLWFLTPPPLMRVALVDYTAPYEHPREHRGAVWTLNHLKYTTADGRSFADLGTHIGYQPDDRNNPTTIAGTDLTPYNWVLVTDAYGVYEADLRDIEHQVGHLSYSRKIFGGLSEADADALVAFSRRGNHLLLEFNSIEDPTEPAARAKLEALFGLKWTGWVGRTFESLRDTTDVPTWVEPNYRAQYGNRSLPTGSVLMLVHRDGRIVLVSSGMQERVVPHVVITAAGEQALGATRNGGAYPFWFPIIKPDSGTEVLAELRLPELPEVRNVLESEGLAGNLPLLMRRRDGGSHRVYLAADLSDSQFEPGSHQVDGPLWLRKLVSLRRKRFEGQDGFWEFYVPALRAVLRAPELQ